MRRARTLLHRPLMPKRLKPQGASPYDQMRDVAGKTAILTAWLAAEGEPDVVAETLGLTRSKLYREIRRLGLGPKLPGFRNSYATVA